MLVAWGADEEAWPFRYEIIHQDPAQPGAWEDLDALLRDTYKTVSGRMLRVAAFGIDTGGHHGSQVYSFCRARRGRRIFACKGMAGAKPIWPGRATQSKSKDPLFLIGVDTAKEAIYAQLRIDPPEPGTRKPGFIHFPVAPNFGPEFYAQLNSERRQIKIRMGKPYAAWVQIRERNEALDVFVLNLAMRKALPRYVETGLQYEIHETPAVPAVIAEKPDGVQSESFMAAKRQQNTFGSTKSSWMSQNTAG
jgi:phage terminase large subunit GpA-like protein